MSAEPSEITWCYGKSASVDQISLMISNGNTYGLNIAVVGVQPPPEPAIRVEYSLPANSGFTIHQPSGSILIPQHNAFPLEITSDIGTSLPSEVDLTIKAFYITTNSSAGSAVIKLRRQTVNVRAGDVTISSLVYDPQGDDITGPGTGEYIEITSHVNGSTHTKSVRDLDGCQIKNSRSITLITFKPHTIISPNETMRIYTRGPRPGETETRLIKFCGAHQAFWGNFADDTATLTNRCRDVLSAFTYHVQNQILPSGITVIATQPQHKRIKKSRTVYINNPDNRNWVSAWEVRDGDSVTVRNITGSVTVAWLGGSFGPVGAVDQLATSEYPRMDAPKFGLLWRVARQLQDGSYSDTSVIGPTYPFKARIPGAPILADDFHEDLTIHGTTGPTFFLLGINDDYVNDNSGGFECIVDLYTDTP